MNQRVRMNAFNRGGGGIQTRRVGVEHFAGSVDQKRTQAFTA